MGDYQMNMSEEKKPTGVLPEGHRVVRIIDMMPDVSKSGNNMFKTQIEDINTKTTMMLFLVSEPKKRWMLKSLLAACELPAAADGVYDWSVTDVMGKIVTAVVEHIQEPWINREGQEVMLKKAKVTEFYPAPKQVDGKTDENIAWEE